MDQMMVDVTNIKNVKAEDEAVLIGKSGNLEISFNELADMSETIVDEIVCNINVRVENTLLIRYFCKSSRMII